MDLRVVGIDLGQRHVQTVRIFVALFQEPRLGKPVDRFPVARVDLQRPHVVVGRIGVPQLLRRAAHQAVQRYRHRQVGLQGDGGRQRLQRLLVAFEPEQRVAHAGVRQRELRIDVEHVPERRQRLFVASPLPERLGDVVQGRRIVRLQRAGAAQEVVGLPVTLLRAPQAGQVQKRGGGLRVDLQRAQEVLLRRVEPPQLP